MVFSMLQSLRFIAEQVVWQEVPGEVSLAFTVSGCPLRCPGCHSSDSWDAQQGLLLTDDYLQQRITQYQNLITCVLFFGGEWRPQALLPLLKLCRAAGLHTCLYSGLDAVAEPITAQLTFLKTGPWIRELGGLDSPTTNQVFTDLRTGKSLNHLFLS